MLPLLLITTPGVAELIIIAVSLLLLFYWVKIIVEIATGNYGSNGTTLAGLLVIIFFGIIGAIIYVFAARPSRLNNP